MGPDGQLFYGVAHQKVMAFCNNKKLITNNNE